MPSSPVSVLRVPATIAAVAAGFVAGSASAGGEGAAEQLFRSSVKETAAARLSHAFEQFWMPATWLELVLGIGLSVALASLLAYHPRGLRRRDALEASEERKTLVVLGVIGAVVSALVVIDQSMALVVFGIGGLIRFRTVIGNPHMTGRAILVVVVGLACGLSQFATALVVAGAAWLVIWWLEARRGGEVKVRLPLGADRQKAALVASHELRVLRCHVRAVRFGASGRSFTITLAVPASLEDELLRQRVEARLGTEIGHAEVELKSAS